MAAPEPLRQWPLTVRLFTGIVLAWDAAYLAWDTSYVGKHLIWSGVWQAFALASLAALAGWRQRWAWWLYLIGPIMYWLSPAWGARFHPFWDAAELALFGLLVSPSMRRHVFTEGLRNWRGLRPGRAWTVCLILSGVFTLAPVLAERQHTVHSVAARIVADVLIWLLFAGAMRLVVFAFQSAARLTRRRGEAPPAAGPEA
jgi:hypothetical protein